MRTPTLQELLNQFNAISTWTKEKKQLKLKIIQKTQQEKLYVFVGSKNTFKLTRFGQTRKVSNQTLGYLHSHNFKSKEIELICMGQEHCDHMYFAAKEIDKNKAIN
jgi:hypothetical protein